MLFNSLVFVLFFSLLLILYYGTTAWTTRKSILLGGSYLFYAAWNPPFVLLLWFSTLVDWFLAKHMAKTEDRARRKLLLLMSLCVNLGLLGFFKYGGFLMENYQMLMSAFGYSVTLPEFSIILPIGISFYTFQTLSYSIDVYRGTTKPSKSFLDFALYVTFFPQLVAGPIVRSTDFLPQCQEKKSVNSTQLFWGLSLILFGLFQKVVLADTFLSPSSDLVFGHDGSLAMLDAWIGALAFSGQIFCDFAGYSICAIGAALCFGFHLPDNFRFPYAAKGFSDFWRRWHISLSTWLRDYLYISVGGNRHGLLRTLISLMVTMVLGGLWHGASWNFVIWGAIHGLLLIGERVVRAVLPAHVNADGFISGALLRIFTFLCVVVTWVFFRAVDLPTAMSIIESMFSFSSAGAKIVPSIEIIKVTVVMFFLVMSHWLLAHTSLEKATEAINSKSFKASMAAMLTLLILTQGGANAFIYFQF